MLGFFLWPVLPERTAKKGIVLRQRNYLRNSDKLFDKTTCRFPIVTQRVV